MGAGAFALALLFTACMSLPYKDDTGFLVSAQADSPEFPVYVNGTLCKDLDNNPGLCSKRLKSNEALAFHFDPQTYAYDLTIACTSPLTVPASTVPSGVPFDLTISPTDFPPGDSFICIGEVLPQDRPQPLSAKWEVRVVIFDSAYEARESIFYSKPYLVLGTYARSSWVFDGSKWKQYKSKTYVKVDDPTKVQAYSESYAERFNFFQFVGPVVK
jgi:hypothetical protein